ncbi:hypothetical protein AB0I30_11375 [Nocardia tengchongensis]|uniref:hypothetical protein n=1 Tax=Nocardia tengchongensis TaxID=2055889 RepID=UPI0033F8A40A
MDEQFRRNLDSQSHRLDDIESTLDALLAGHYDVASLPSAKSPVPQTYPEITTDNEQLRLTRGWLDVDLDAALTVEHRVLFDRWRAGTRITWGTEDLAAVAVAGLIGASATWLDHRVDRAVLGRFTELGKTKVFQRWDRAGKRLPIDYMGPGFGGKAHRVRSAGHDLFRIFESTGQIIDAEFRGTRWADHGKESVAVSGAFRGDIDTVADALSALFQHLAADFVTPMGLPMPGMSLLFETDNRELRKLVHQAYLGTEHDKGRNNGLNLRSGLISAGLPVIATDVLIRLHIHATTYARSGTTELDAAQRALRDELLLAAHSITTAASIGKTVARALCLEGDKKYAAVRHINVPALLRLAWLSASVVHNARSRTGTGAASWEELLEELNRPQSLSTAALLVETAEQDAKGLHRTGWSMKA